MPSTDDMRAFEVTIRTVVSATSENEAVSRAPFSKHWYRGRARELTRIEYLWHRINDETDLRSYVWHSGGGIHLVRIDDAPAYWLFSESEYGEEFDIGIYHESDTQALAFFADMRIDQIIDLLHAIPADFGQGVQPKGGQ